MGGGSDEAQAAGPTQTLLPRLKCTGGDGPERGAGRRPAVFLLLRVCVCVIVSEVMCVCDM